ncbi:MAG: hypothetical protein HFF00_04920 [Ruminiclostridium sp.]|nr:hypothetical protein [Ruminiclostridium sp.]
MTLQELSTYYKLNEQLEQNREMLSSLYTATRPGAQVITGMPHAQGVSDKVGDLAIEIGDLQSRIDHLESRCAEEKKKLEKYIDTIRNDQTRMIFRLRFIHCMTWFQVAETIGGQNTVNSVKATCYRHVKSCSSVTRRDA